MEIALEESPWKSVPSKKRTGSRSPRCIRRIETFSPEEVECAIELVDLALTPNNTDYTVLVADRDGTLVGYVCYGPTPMTEGTYDLYWIASDPTVRGQGVGASLISGMEADMRRRRARRHPRGDERHGGLRPHPRLLRVHEVRGGGPVPGLLQGRG